VLAYLAIIPLATLWEFTDSFVAVAVGAASIGVLPTFAYALLTRPSDTPGGVQGADDQMRGDVGLDERRNDDHR
jgi:hypothetical protein